LSRLKRLIICTRCKENNLEWNIDKIRCRDCGHETSIIGDIPRYIDDEYHSNFGVQWNRFATVQLDSCNGSIETETRLLCQSKLRPEYFNRKTILEVGAGNGRFTEILLKFGAQVVAVDYSRAIDANLRLHHSQYEYNRLLPLQASIFDMPLKTRAFDIVLCYGVIQHTGNNELAIKVLSEYVCHGGKLLMDIYSNGIRHYNPFIYAIRPIFARLNISNEHQLVLVKKFVSLVFPVQLTLLRFLKGRSGLFELLKYLINRSPNSVYGINLYLDGKISLMCAYKWCVLDTFDAWAPKHDSPVSRNRWMKMIRALEAKGFRIDAVDLAGQGHTAVLTKSTLPVTD
jgi:2-polyprenyl-3-methyl-5-hydroxy-6-metoxy-1,4-benzoquinol methylase